MFTHSQVRFSTMATVLVSTALAALAALALISIREVLGWIGIAVFLAVVLNPLVESLSRRMRRGSAVALVSFLILLLVTGVALLMVPPLVEQIGDLSQKAPDWLDHLRVNPRFQRLDARFHLLGGLDNPVKELPKYLTGFASGLVALVGQLVKGIFAAVSVFFLTVFFLLDGPLLTEQLFTLFPPATRPRAERMAHSISRTTSRYAIGSVSIAGVAALVSMALLSVAGVPYFLPLGLGVGILGLIPFVGALIGGCIVVCVAWMSVGFAKAMLVLAGFVLYQQLENHIMQPVVHRHTVRLSALFIAVSLLMGAELAGIRGAIFAIPVAGALQIVLRECWVVWRERRDAEFSGLPASLPEQDPLHPH